MSLVPQQICNRLHSELALTSLEANFSPNKQPFNEVCHAKISCARLVCTNSAKSGRNRIVKVSRMKALQEESSVYPF